MLESKHLNLSPITPEILLIRVYCLFQANSLAMAALGECSGVPKESASLRFEYATIRGTARMARTRCSRVVSIAREVESYTIRRASFGFLNNLSTTKLTILRSGKNPIQHRSLFSQDSCDSSQCLEGLMHRITTRFLQFVYANVIRGLLSFSYIIIFVGVILWILCTRVVLIYREIFFLHNSFSPTGGIRSSAPKKEDRQILAKSVNMYPLNMGLGVSQP